MHLLPSCPVPIPQFASLSYLLSDVSSEGPRSSFSMGEPMIICSPVASISSSSSLSALEELHAYLSVLLKSAEITTTQTQQQQQASSFPSDRLVLNLFREDEKLLMTEDSVQIYRPQCGDGLALHYLVIRDDAEIIMCLGSHISAATKMMGNAGGTAAKTTSSSNLSIPMGCVGIVFCVGFSGLPHATGSSFLNYSLTQRIMDCTMLLTKMQDSSLARAVLSSFLLADDEQRKSNDMVLAPNLVAFTSTDEMDKAAWGPMGALSPLNMASGVASGVTTVASGVASGVKRMSLGMAVINRANPGGQGNETTPGGGPSGRGEVVDLDNELMMGVTTLALRPNSAEAALVMTEHMRVLSVAETDTFLRKYSATGHERKVNLDLTGSGKPRFRRRKTEARDPDLDGFDYKGPTKQVAKRRLVAADSIEIASVTSADSKPSVRHSLMKPRNDSKSKNAVPTISASRSDITTSRRLNTGSNHNPEDSKTTAASRLKQRPRSQANHNSFDDDTSYTSEGRSTALESTSSSSRVQVNIALNEDLSCSYKLSQLSTCSVEGVVQIQVKTTERSPNPFYLLLRDPAGHVDSLQENKKFADDITDSAGPLDGNVRHKFAVTIPKGENYFPVLRYKCSGDLRPVPIRVQARVKVDGGFSRVALQISSNPNNEANLTDLTIIMGVPDELRGETLMTQPAGGVWNEAKRSVIWCVSELGNGEKFQLQARFEASKSFDPYNEAKPNFPVLVRCQCLFAQLSNVELEVKDIPDKYPADVTMKLARRFRLSHRERS